MVHLVQRSRYGEVLPRVTDPSRARASAPARLGTAAGRWPGPVRAPGGSRTRRFRSTRRVYRLPRRSARPSQSAQPGVPRAAGPV